MRTNRIEDTVAAEPTGRLADFAAGLNWADIDADSRTVARHCLLDFLGVALAGAPTDTARMVLELEREDGGVAEATAIGTPHRLSVRAAAMANGVAGHALDYDDVHMAMVGHPTVAVMPAALALAEQRDLRLDGLLEAFTAGLETACRVGRFMGEDHYSRGWHCTATIGSFGAAAAAGRLLGLDGGQMAMALGIAGTQASGLKSMFGTDCKPLHAGKAAAAGVVAARLAAKGFSSRPDVLECPQGFGATQTGTPSAEAALDGLGAQLLIRNTLFKYHAACYGTHAAIDAARAIAIRDAAAIDDIDRIEVRVRGRYLKVCDIPEPTSGLEAKFSLRFTTAMALAGVETGDPDGYGDALTGDARLVAWRDKVRVSAFDEPDRDGAEVAVFRRDGVVLREAANVDIPAADLGVQETRLKDKFLALAGPVLGAEKAAETIAMIADPQTAVRDLLAVVRR